jgi:hypothetical protein
LLVARKRRATSKLVTEQRCAGVLPRACAAQQHKTATHACGRERSAWQRASRAAARRDSAWAQQRKAWRAAACGSASRQRARCGARARGVVCGAQTAAASRAVRARQRQRGCAPAASRTTRRGGSFLRERWQVAAGKCKREHVTQTRRTRFIFQPSTLHCARRPRAPGSLRRVRPKLRDLFLESGCASRGRRAAGF